MSENLEQIEAIAQQVARVVARRTPAQKARMALLAERDRETFAERIGVTQTKSEEK